MCKTCWQNFFYDNMSHLLIGQQSEKMQMNIPQLVSTCSFSCNNTTQNQTCSSSEQSIWAACMLCVQDCPCGCLSLCVCVFSPSLTSICEQQMFCVTYLFELLSKPTCAAAAVHADREWEAACFGEVCRVVAASHFLYRCVVGARAGLEAQLRRLFNTRCCRRR